MRLMDQSDRSLIQRWQREADGDAFSELVRRHAPIVFCAMRRTRKKSPKIPSRKSANCGGYAGIPSAAYCTPSQPISQSTG